MYKRTFYYLTLVSFIISFLSFTSSVNSQENLKYYELGIMKNLFNDVNINDAGAACNVWIKEINDKEKSRYDIQFKIFENYNEVREALNGGKLVFLALNVDDYLEYKDEFKLQPEFIASFKGDTKFNYLLLVPKDKNYKEIKEIKNSKIGITSKYNTNIPVLWFDVLCSKNKILNGKKFFNEIITTPDESKLILDLFFGKIDACVVPEKIFKLMGELNPQLEERLVPLTSSPPFVFSLMCYTKNFSDQADREYFVENALTMHETAGGKQIMNLMKIEKLVPFHNEDLNSYSELLNDHKKINKE